MDYGYSDSWYDFGSVAPLESNGLIVKPSVNF